MKKKVKKCVECGQSFTPNKHNSSRQIRCGGKNGLCYKIHKDRESVKRNLYLRKLGLKYEKFINTP